MKTRLRLRSRSPRGVVFALVGLIGVSTRGCEVPPQLVAVPCPPPETRAGERVRLYDIAGDYTLTMVAAEGSAAGRSSTGALSLLRYEELENRPGPASLATADASVRFPIYGGVTQLSLDSIGATAPGDLTSIDRDRPGVLGLEWTVAAAPADSLEAMLRLGADANGGAPTRFDGARLVLTEITADGENLRGLWDSGGGEISATGYFCAAPVGS